MESFLSGFYDSFLKRLPDSSSTLRVCVCVRLCPCVRRVGDKWSFTFSSAPATPVAAAARRSVWPPAPPPSLLRSQIKLSIPPVPVSAKSPRYTAPRATAVQVCACRCVRKPRGHARRALACQSNWRKVDGWEKQEGGRARGGAGWLKQATAGFSIFQQGTRTLLKTSAAN